MTIKTDDNETMMYDRFQRQQNNDESSSSSSSSVTSVVDVDEETSNSQCLQLQQRQRLGVVVPCDDHNSDCCPRRRRQRQQRYGGRSPSCTNRKECSFRRMRMIVMTLSCWGVVFLILLLLSVNLTTNNTPFVLASGTSHQLLSSHDADNSKSITLVSRRKRRKLRRTQQDVEASSNFLQQQEFSFSDPRSIVIKQDERPQQQDEWFMEHLYKDHNDCFFNKLPTLHQTLSERPIDLQLNQNYTQHVQGVYNRYRQEYSVETHVEPLEEATTTLTLSSSSSSEESINLILWGRDRRYVERALVMSAYTSPSLDHNIVKAKGQRRIFFVSPLQDESEPLLTQHHSSHKFSIIEHMDHIMDITPPVGGGSDYHYIFFAINHYNIFAHVLIDTLPYLAYLKDLYPNSKFILPNPSNHLVETILTTIDPDFVQQRVIWINCSLSSNNDPEGWCGNHMVRIHSPASNDEVKLTVAHPHDNLRHMVYLDHVRRWIVEAAWAQDAQSQQQSSPYAEHGTIIYYTRNDATALHGRAMDLGQEELILTLIKESLVKYNRPEQFLVFDGTQSFREQYDMFRNASVVIGAHGGGLANLLFTKHVDQNCGARTKVIEFLNNPMTSPQLQDGDFKRSYYEIYTTTPWLEYHHVLYHPRSSVDATFINMNDFQLALEAVFGGSERDETSTTQQPPPPSMMTLV